MNKLVQGIKFGLSIVAGFGIEILCCSIANKFVDDDHNAVQKACIGVGSAVIGGMIADAANNYISKQVDEIAGTVTVIAEALKGAEINNV